MARPRKSETETQAPPPAGHNGPMPSDETVRNFTHAIEKDMDRLATLKGEYMQDCRQIREAIARTLVEAKDAGIPKREFKLVIRTRALENKLDAITNELEPDERESYDAIRTALGDYADLPLGQAALDKASNRPAA